MSKANKVRWDMKYVTCDQTEVRQLLIDWINMSMADASEYATHLPDEHARLIVEARQRCDRLGIAWHDVIIDETAP